VSPASHWLHPRRKRFWVAALLLVYTLGGFFAVPLLVERLLTAAVRDNLHREASIERVRFNPYVLSLEISGFELMDSDGAQLIAFDRLFVNFQLSSLFRWAWTYREVRLEGARLRFERFAPGDSRLSRLLAGLEADTGPAVADPPGSAALPRLLIHDLSLSDGVVLVRDNVPAEPVELTLGPITGSVQELNTLPDRFGRQAVEIRLPDDARLSWQGSISLGPLHSEGKLALENSPLHQTIAYLKAVMPLESMQAYLSLRTDYRIVELEDGSVDLELDSIEADLTELAVAGLTPPTKFLVLPALTARGGALRFPERELTVASVELSNPEMTAWLTGDGELSLAALANAEAAAPGGDSGSVIAAEPEAPDWRMRLDAFRIAGGRVGFTDNSVEPAAVVDFQDLELGVTGISNEAEAVFPVELSGALAAGGGFRFDGQVTALPALTASGTATVHEIPLPLAQPYVQQGLRIQLEEGVLDSTTDVTVLQGGAVTAAGELTISGLRATDPRGNEPLVQWQTLHIDRFEADRAAGTLGLSTVRFDQPFARVVINEDLTTNLDGLLVPAEPITDDSTGSAPQGPRPALVISSILVEDGSLDFSDFSLPLPFATQVRGLDGRVTTVDTASAEPALVSLEGQVDDYGLARIDGTMDPMDPIRHTDVSLEFRNLPMADLSAYTAQFAGREIAGGKLDLDLQYRIDAGQLQGANDIVMSDLVLGDTVDSPDAASLPLGLAVALLKDANGVIDIDLPVEGDINDPEFRIGGVIWQAISGLITKVVSAPFRLLGSLVGIESEDLGQFQFLAGRYDLTPPEREKILQLRQALQQRPELTIAVAGAYDPAVDTPALQYQRLRSTVLERMGQEHAGSEDELRMLIDEVRVVLEDIHMERFPEVPLEDVKAAHRAPPEDDPEAEPVLDELAYAADLRDRLLAAEEITTQDLEALADARAEAVRTAFLDQAEFGPANIAIEAPTVVESEDGEWVMMELGVAAD
jgi:hypothetical protein